MIKINNRFSAKSYRSGWELHDTQPSTHEKSKTGFTTDVTFHPTFAFLGNAVLDKAIGDCGELSEVLQAISDAKTEIKDAAGNI